jgi:aryl-alcohol dehydrogenase-like predicted oxidoreductase
VRLADDLVLTRIGYGAIQLAGPMAWGPPKDRDAAKSVLRAVVDLGITHIDTSDYYGPQTVNELIRETLHPYPAGLHVVTKVGARRGPDKSWPAALSRDELVQAVHDNLEHLGVESLDLVNLRMTDSREASAITGPFSVLADLQQDGLIRHLGVSNVSAEQVAAAQSIAPVVAVQNFYNLAIRADDTLVDQCAEQGIAFVPFFPLGGFRPLQSGVLDEVAAGLGISRLQVALAWLLQRSPTILLIPGTSSVAHLRDNAGAAGVELPAKAVAALNAVGAAGHVRGAEECHRLAVAAAGDGPAAGQARRRAGGWVPCRRGRDTPGSRAGKGGRSAVPSRSLMLGSLACGHIRRVPGRRAGRGHVVPDAPRRRRTD